MHLGVLVFIEARCMKPTVLFLDFDGVTHPECCTADQLFKCLPLIEDVLRYHPGVEIVISSSWRVHHSPEELRECFSADIAARVVGVTPIAPRTEGESAKTRVRQVECMTWLDAHRPDADWIAIDDVPWQYELGCPNLLLTNHRTGFSEADARYLHSVLKGIT